MVRIELTSPVAYLTQEGGGPMKEHVATIYFAQHPPDTNLPVCMFTPLSADVHENKVKLTQNLIVPWGSIRSIAYTVELEQAQETDASGITHEAL
jgi:hypothetical protein